MIRRLHIPLLSPEDVIPHLATGDLDTPPRNLQWRGQCRKRLSGIGALNIHIPYDHPRLFEF